MLIVMCKYTLHCNCNHELYEHVKCNVLYIKGNIRKLNMIYL